MLSPNCHHRLAALDLGSNALRLLVADCAKNSIIPVIRKREAIRLAQGMGTSLTAAAKKRAWRAVAGFSRQARQLGAERVIMVATHAARKAGDGAALVAALRQECQLDQAVLLSPQQESYLARLGVRSVCAGDTRGAWVADIGAGSCELAPLDGQTDGCYLPFGALSLTEKFILHDPPRQTELNLLRAYLHKHDLHRPRIKGRLLATSGTASCLAAIDLQMACYEPDKINNHTVKRARLQAVLGRLAMMPVSRRAALPGMEEGRADIIIAGLLLLSEIMTAHQKASVTILDAGILEGSLLAFVNICKEIFHYEASADELDL